MASRRVVHLLFSIFISSTALALLASALLPSHVDAIPLKCANMSALLTLLHAILFKCANASALLTLHAIHFFKNFPNASALLARVFIYLFEQSLVAVSHSSIQMPKEQVYIYVCDHTPVAAVATASGGPVAAVATDVARSARPHSSIAQDKLNFDEIYACVRCELCADFRIQNVSDPFVSGDWCRQTPLSLFSPGALPSRP